MTINNIIMGTTYIDYHGEMNFKNLKNGDTGKLSLNMLRQININRKRME